MQIWFWTVWGRRTRPGRHQDAPRHSGDWVFGGSWAENVAPRVDFGIPGKSKMGPKPIFEDRRALWSPKKVKKEGFGRHLEI